MKPLLNLVMIVKDEAKSIQTVIEAVKPYIDRWTILDTGSTDGTQDIIKEVLQGLPGQIFEESFIDYATSRNRALELDAGCSDSAHFQFMLSGDEYLSGGSALREYLDGHRESDVDLHRIRILIEEVTFFSPRIFRTGSAWKYVGAVHEFPTHWNGDAFIGTCKDASIEHIIADYERRFSTIWEKHIPILEAQLEENDNDERALLFLARSYEALLGMMKPGEQITYAMKAASLCLRRLAIKTGSEAEHNFVKMKYLCYSRIANIYSDEEFLSRCLELQKLDPTRPDTALLCLNAAVKVLPATKVYEFALNTAKVAEEAVSIDNSSPVSTSVGWKAHLIAAKAAKQLSVKHPDAFKSRVKDHVKAGLALGGPWALFQSLTTEETNGVSAEDEDEG